MSSSALIKNICKGILKDRTNCKTPIFYGNDTFCSKHKYFEDFSDAEYTLLANNDASFHLCKRCNHWHNSTNKNCNRCNEMSRKVKSTDKIRCNGITVNWEQCTNYTVNETPMCALHQHMNGYTPEMLANVTLCKGCRSMHYKEEGTICDKCKERCKKRNNTRSQSYDKCKHLDCTHTVEQSIIKKREYLDYCGDHQVYAWHEKMKSEGKKICKNYIRGCKNEMQGDDLDHSYCTYCRLKNYNNDSRSAHRNTSETPDEKPKKSKDDSLYVNKLLAKCYTGKSDKSNDVKVVTNDDYKISYENVKRNNKVINDEKVIKPNVPIRENKPIPDNICKGYDKKRVRCTFQVESVKGAKFCIRHRYLVGKFTEEELLTIPEGKIAMCSSKDCNRYHKSGKNSCERCLEEGRLKDARRRTNVDYLKKRDERAQIKQYWKVCRQKKRSQMGDAEYKKFIAEKGRERNATHPEYGLRRRDKDRRDPEAKYKLYLYTSKKRGYEYNLTKEETFELFKGTCYLCKKVKYEEGGVLLGIDREDNDIGYESGNCKSCCTHCNMMKCDLEKGLLLQKVIHILYTNKLIPKVDGTVDAENTCVEFFGNANATGFNATSHNARRRHIKFNLTQEQFDIIKSFPCYICGKNNSTQHSNGIDRIDSSKDYGIENCISCCKTCNYMKGNYPLHEFMYKMYEQYINFMDPNDIGEHIRTREDVIRTSLQMVKDRQSEMNSKFGHASLPLIYISEIYDVHINSLALNHQAQQKRVKDKLSGLPFELTNMNIELEIEDDESVININDVDMKSQNISKKGNGNGQQKRESYKVLQKYTIPAPKIIYLDRKTEYINALEREISDATDITKKAELQQHLIDCLKSDIISDGVYNEIVKFHLDFDDEDDKDNIRDNDNVDDAHDNKNDDKTDTNDVNENNPEDEPTKSAYQKRREKSIAKYGIDGHRFIESTECNIKRSKNDPEKAAELRLSLATFYNTRIIPEKAETQTGYERKKKCIALKKLREAEE